MISLLLVCVVTFFVNGQEKVKKDETCTVAIAPSKGFAVVSPNPVTVTKGEQAEFRIRLDENYACVDSDHYRFVGDRVLIDDVSDDRT